MGDIMGIINALRQENQDLRAKLDRGGTKLKFPEPAHYDGTPGTLRGFLTQLRAYMAFHTTNLPTEADKVMCAAAFLRGSALAWFEPT